MKKLTTIINKTIKDSWKNLRKDYKHNLLCEEWSMQSAFYYHLRTQLKEYIDKWDIQIWTEYHISNWDYLTEKANQKNTKKFWYIDLVVVSIDKKKLKELHLKYCVEKIHALVEFKYALTTNKTNLFLALNSNKSISDKEKLEKLSKIYYPSDSDDKKKDNWKWYSPEPKYKYFFGINEYMKFWELEYSFEAKCSENNGKFMDL